MTKEKHFESRKSIWLDQETWNKLLKIGRDLDRPVSWLIRKAVSDWLKMPR